MLVLIGVPYSQAASGFVASSFWVLLAGLYFGYVLNKTGLGKRLAFYMLKLFPPTYYGLAIGATVIVLLFSLLTPSVTVRVAIIGPIVLGLIECAGIKKKSSASAGILLIAFVMSLTIGEGWYTGALAGPITFGMAPAVAQPFITPAKYASIFLVPMEIFLLCNVIDSFFIAVQTKTKIPMFS